MKYKHDIQLDGHLFSKKIAEGWMACDCGIALKDSFVKEIVDYQFKQAGLDTRDIYGRSQTVEALKRTIKNLDITQNELFHNNI